jgi:hypothetical protein
MPQLLSRKSVPHAQGTLEVVCNAHEPRGSFGAAHTMHGLSAARMHASRMLEHMLARAAHGRRACGEQDGSDMSCFDRRDDSGERARARASIATLCMPL